VDKPDFSYKTGRYPLTRRGWLFLGVNGGPCDRKCKHCYYAFQKDFIFYDVKTLKMFANKFRYYYGLEYADLTGGEPTIYPGIEGVLEHMAMIGLKSTFITHGQNLTRKKVKSYESAGLGDYLISLHGLEKSHDSIVNQGGFKRVVRNLDNLGRPVRFNTTIMNLNYKDLPGLAKFLSQREPSVYNMINFNPFHAWSLKTEIDFQEKNSTMAPYIKEAIDILEEKGWEVNVRYMPLCIAKKYGFAKNQVGFYQVPYDKWEWDLAVTHNLRQEQIYKLGGRERAQLLIAHNLVAPRIHDPRMPAGRRCGICRFRLICDGPPPQYQRRYGVDELQPEIGELVTDPMYFRRNYQQKQRGEEKWNSTSMAKERI